MQSFIYWPLHAAGRTLQELVVNGPIRYKPPPGVWGRTACVWLDTSYKWMRWEYYKLRQARFGNIRSQEGELTGKNQCNHIELWQTRTASYRHYKSKNTNCPVKIKVEFSIETSVSFLTNVNIAGLSVSVFQLRNSFPYFPLCHFLC